MHIKSTILLAGTLFLTACGDDTQQAKTTASNDDANTTAVVESPPAQAGFLHAKLAEKSICEVFTVSELKQMFPTENQVEASETEYSSRYSCNYNWDRPDAKSREKAMLENMMQAAQGQAEKMTMRQKMPSNQLTITLQESKRAADNFVPAKLTEEQLQERIKAAKEMAAKRLTDEQKSVAGDAANEMVEKLMKQNNQNEAVEGLGDAAYWTNVGSGGLNVLVGDVQMYIGPMIAETAEADKDHAIAIARAILSK